MNFLNGLFNLRSGEDQKSKVLEDVKANISFRGANLWILACAIIVASVGLNVNSTAVVIGAMLISPLMGPIVGAGFALGIYDFSLLKRSLKNLLIATIVSLLVSAIYFLISPFKEASEEILARTSPNLYDVLIAFFGGLVGVIAITRTQKGNPIPGVAIATALMPPLCTAGYGLATGNYTFFLGALFLYSINCVFICIATFMIVKYLKYPIYNFVDKKSRVFVTRLISVIILMMIIPSAYFAFTLYQQQQFRQNAERFIDGEFLQKGNTLVYKKIHYTPQQKSIELAFLRKVYNSAEYNNLSKVMNRYGLANTKLVIKPNTNEQFEQFKNDVLNEVRSKNQEILAAKKADESKTVNGESLLAELQVFFPKIKEVGTSRVFFTTENDSTYVQEQILIRSDAKINAVELDKIKDFAEKRLRTENLIIQTLE